MLLFYVLYMLCCTRDTHYHCAAAVWCGQYGVLPVLLTLAKWYLQPPMLSLQYCIVHTVLRASGHAELCLLRLLLQNLKYEWGSQLFFLFAMWDHFSNLLLVATSHCTNTSLFNGGAASRVHMQKMIRYAIKFTWGWVLFPGLGSEGTGLKRKYW